MHTATKQVRERAKLIDINNFLAQKRLAIVGVSRHPQDYTRVVMREFVVRGYEVAPVNPNCTAVEDRSCVSRVGDVAPPVNAALIFVPTDRIGEVVKDCAANGVRHIWIRQQVDADAAATLARLRAEGIGVVVGECPLMFLPNAGFFHRFHGMLAKVTRQFPR